MHLGIDFGTTNSAIALSDGKQVYVFKVEEELPDLLPSLIYLTRHFRQYLGSTAKEAYLDRNTDRPSLFRKIYVGDIEITVAGAGSSPITFDQQIYVYVDILAPGRLLKSIKSTLRDKSYTGTDIFGKTYKVTELISLLLGDLATTVGEVMGEPLESVVIGRPVKFSDDPETDEHAEATIRAAAQSVGINNVGFLPEPIAAAYGFHVALEERQLALIFDFGGGTLDLTVANIGGADAPEILAAEGVLIGGDDFDRHIMKYLLKNFGLHTKLADGNPFPSKILNQLLDWQTAGELAKPENFKLIKEAAKPDASDDPETMAALKSLVEHNLIYKLMQEIERAKVELSKQHITTIRFKERDVDLYEPFSREQFNRLIRQELQEIDAALDRVVEKAGIDPKSIDIVIRTGGSAQIPAFIQLLEDKFDCNSFSQDERQMTGVVQGLAVYANTLDDAATVARKTPLLAQIADKPREFTRPVEITELFSHFIVGLDAEGQFYCYPDEGKPLPTPALVNGARVRSDQRVLLVTTYSRFVRMTIPDLTAATEDRSRTHPYLILGDGEKFIAVHNWERLVSQERTLLLSRDAKMRVFRSDLLTNELDLEERWQLPPDRRIGIPAGFFPADAADEIVLLTRTGKANRVKTTLVPPKGALMMKSPGKTAASGIVTAVAMPKEVRQWLFIDEKGEGQAVLNSKVPLAQRPAQGGVGLVKTRKALTLLPLGVDRVAYALTSTGRVLPVNLSRFYSTTPTSLFDLEKKETVVRVWLESDDLLDADERGKRG